MNYGLSAVSGRSGTTRWVEIALGGACSACHSLLALAESQLDALLPDHATSEGMGRV